MFGSFPVCIIKRKRIVRIARAQSAQTDLHTISKMYRVPFCGNELGQSDERL